MSYFLYVPIKKLCVNELTFRLYKDFNFNFTLARDERGTEVLIGASLTGIVIRQGTNTQFFKWNDITNLVNHKRDFGIECQNYERSVQFILDEPDSAKYVWKMCKFIP